VFGSVPGGPLRRVRVVPTYNLHPLERDMVRLALRGDVDMRRYVPEVMSLCYKLGLPDPPWFEDEAVRDRVAANRGNVPLFPEEPAD
jgi:hypothetical protein